MNGTRKMKKQNKKVTNKSIKKISKADNIEDLFMLTVQFNKSDNERLIKSIKDNISKNKEISPQIKSLIKKSKDSAYIKENITKSLIEEIENKRQTLADLSSEKRKKGKDTLIADLKIMFSGYKLKLFKATYEKKDYLILRKNLKEAESYLSHL